MACALIGELPSAGSEPRARGHRDGGVAQLIDVAGIVIHHGAWQAVGGEDHRRRLTRRRRERRERRVETLRERVDPLGQRVPRTGDAHVCSGMRLARSGDGAFVPGQDHRRVLRRQHDGDDRAHPVRCQLADRIVDARPRVQHPDAHNDMPHAELGVEMALQRVTLRPRDVDER